MSIKHLEAYEAANETAARIDAMVELKRLAEGATQGEWRYGPGDGEDENPVVFVDLPQASAVAISILFEADWATDVDAKFVSKANPAAVLALIAENESLRKDAERYRWFRDHSIQIVHTSTISWAYHLDKLIDDSMSPGYYAIRNQPGEV